MASTDEAETAGRRWRLLTIEALVAFGVAVVLTILCTSIQVDPLQRMGQVSGLASMQVRFMLLAAPILAAVLTAMRWREGRYLPLVSRLACAATAGLASGMFAGGILVALRGTEYALNGPFGDSAVLIDWANSVLDGHGLPSPYYPPGQIYLIAGVSQLLGLQPVYGLKMFNTIGLLAVGPSAYLAWRLWLSPGWALGIGGITALPMMEAYRPYPLLVLVVFVPVIARFLHTVRRADEYDVMPLARRGLFYGVVLGVLFLIYSGWFHWSAPGVIVAAVVLFPYRRAPRRAALLCATAGIVFALIAGHYVLGVLQAPAIADDFHYFDSTSDPAYITMWRGATPGPFRGTGAWPPTGELGGVSVFTLVIAAGGALALAFGRSHTLVIGLGALLTSAWFLRFWKAHYMWKTKLVQLYPRTTAQIFYCLIVATGLAVMWWTARARTRAPADSPLRSPWGLVAALVGIMFVFTQAGSHLTDRYMPSPKPGFHGELAWNSHKSKTGVSRARHAAIKASSEGSGDDDRQYVNDEDPTTVYTSMVHATPDAAEWIELEMPVVYWWQRFVITPAEDGWPSDFVVEVWNGTQWVARYTGVGVQRPTDRLWLYWGRWEATPRTRFRATRLGEVAGGYALRLAEIELFE